MLTRLFLAGGVVAGLTACATPAPPLPAVFNFAGAGCATAPVLTGALSLIPEEERARHSVEAQVTSTSPCLNRENGSVPYVVYAMPADIGDKTLAVGGLLEAMRIFAPSVSVLDRDGRVTRTFEPHDYMFRGPAYSVQFRPREGDAYILVTSEPALVGQRHDAIQIGTNTTTVYTGYGASNITTGWDANTSRHFSHEGGVQVLVHDTDTEEDGAA